MLRCSTDYLTVICCSDKSNTDLSHLCGVFCIGVPCLICTFRTFITIIYRWNNCILLSGNYFSQKRIDWHMIYRRVIPTEYPFYIVSMILYDSESTKNCFFYKSEYRTKFFVHARVCCSLSKNAFSSYRSDLLCIFSFFLFSKIFRHLLVLFFWGMRVKNFQKSAFIFTIIFRVYELMFQIYPESIIIEISIRSIHDFGFCFFKRRF